MTMPGRKYTAPSSSYRYGFQNQEIETELWGGAINFTYRVEDPRLNRFFSVDPLESKYVHNSPYAFSENRLIDSKELEGLEAIWVFGSAEYMAGVYGHEVSLGFAIDLNGMGGGFSHGHKVGVGLSVSAGVGITVFPNMKNLQDMGGRVRQSILVALY
jgi:hypothetical protein